MNTLGDELVSRVEGSSVVSRNQMFLDLLLKLNFCNLLINI